MRRAAPSQELTASQESADINFAPRKKNPKPKPKPKPKTPEPKQAAPKATEPKKKKQDKDQGIGSNIKKLIRICLICLF